MERLLLEQVFGLFVVISTYLLYAAYCVQIAQCWRANICHDISPYVLVLGAMNLWLWAAWGFVTEPQDYYRVWSMAPGVALVIAALFQRWHARPRLKAVAAAVAFPAAMLGLVAWSCARPEAIPNGVKIAVPWTALVISLTLTLTGAPAQYIENARLIATRRVPIVSMFFLSTVVLGYAAWLPHGFLHGDVFVLVTQGLGTLLWGSVLVQLMYAKLALGRRSAG